MPKGDNKVVDIICEGYMVRVANVIDAEQLNILNEEYCSKTYPLHKFELLTGKENNTAQIVYGKLVYEDDGEIHLSKRMKR